MRRVILGTAGHIDHGKTALVRALTGVDTDRLPEERARGITIDLGFAQLRTADGAVQMGVVDVPGHEDFVRTMVAGATGMDVVMLVVAADEGVMPQTREHLDIVRLLGVPEMVVALSKADLVDEEWLELVLDDVAELLAPTPYRGARCVPTSATEGTGLEDLLAALESAGLSSRERRGDDLVRLPVDRAFTVQGTGTVVTGTLWSGQLAPGERVRILPEGVDTRVRALQVHGQDVARAEPGQRVAVALTGVAREESARGATLVTSGAWTPSWMITVRASMLSGAGRGLETGQRIRVHCGTAEVLARCALLDASEILPGGEGWVQLRLEEPVLSRAGDHLVLRSYSPLATLGGGQVAEPSPPKRRRLDPAEARLLGKVLDEDPEGGVAAVLALAGWGGAPEDALPVLTGRTPGVVAEALTRLEGTGVVRAKGRAFASGIVEEARTLILSALDSGHEDEPLRDAVPMERLRTALPTWAAAGLADAVLSVLDTTGAVGLVRGGARRPGFEPRASESQRQACQELRDAYGGAGLAPPFVQELPEPLLARADLSQLLRFLEEGGELVCIDDGLFFDAVVLAAAAATVKRELAGRTDLGPSDFREVLPVSRKHLMPLLAYLDGVGVTQRRGPVRDVPPGS